MDDTGAPPGSHLEFATSPPATEEQRDDIFIFLLLNAPQSSNTRQFALGDFVGHCPEGTEWTVAVVKKLWHATGSSSNPWITVELQFRRTKDGPALATLGTAHLHRDPREARREHGLRHVYERRANGDLERMFFGASQAQLVGQLTASTLQHPKYDAANKGSWLSTRE